MMKHNSGQPGSKRALAVTGSTSNNTAGGTLVLGSGGGRGQDCFLSLKLWKAKINGRLAGSFWLQTVHKISDSSRVTCQSVRELCHTLQHCAQVSAAARYCDVCAELGCMEILTTPGGMQGWKGSSLCIKNISGSEDGNRKSNSKLRASWNKLLHITPH